MSGVCWVEETREDVTQLLSIRNHLLSPSEKPQMEPGIRGVLVLAALCKLVSSLRHRHHYVFIEEPKSWSAAQRYCREKHIDLVTVGDPRDLEALAGWAGTGNPVFFLGLHRGWGWSPSTTDDYKEGEPAYWNWAGGQPAEHYCGSMGPTGEWFATDCSSDNDFFCYNASAADVSQRFASQGDGLTWSAARARCRALQTELPGARDRTANEELRRLVKSSPVWIGLTRTSWSWSDGSYLSFTPWEGFEARARGPPDCAALNVTSRSLGMMKCDEAAPFICHSDLTRKLLVRLELSADDSPVDMNDPAATASLLKWVKKGLTDKGASEETGVSWRRLPEKGNRRDESKVCAKTV